MRHFDRSDVHGVLHVSLHQLAKILQGLEDSFVLRHRAVIAARGSI